MSVGGEVMQPFLSFTLKNLSLPCSVWRLVKVIDMVMLDKQEQPIVDTGVSVAKGHLDLECSVFQADESNMSLATGRGTFILSNITA